MIKGRAVFVGADGFNKRKGAHNLTLKIEIDETNKVQCSEYELHRDAVYVVRCRKLVSLAFGFQARSL